MFDGIIDGCRKAGATWCDALQTQEKGKDAKDSKETKEKGKDAKDSKETKDKGKDVKESKETKEVKDAKDSKESKEAKDKWTKNEVPKCILRLLRIVNKTKIRNIFNFGMKTKSQKWYYYRKDMQFSYGMENSCLEN